MAAWRTIEGEVPELAAAVRARFEATGLGILATLHASGAPRVCPLEPLFSDGELWFGMMEGSWKARDLQRDPRFALHAATVDKDVAQGDAKVEGRAIELPDPAALARFAAAVEAATGHEPPPPYHLFRAELSSLSTLRLGDPADHLVIESWIEGRGYARVERR